MRYKPKNALEDEKLKKMIERKIALEEEEKFSKEKMDKRGNYAKYVREMYWPNVSLKKQLELEHVKSTLHNQNIRKSIEDYGEADDKGGKSSKDVGVYERPWRAAMARGPRSIDPNSSEFDRLPPFNQGSQSGVLLSPKPHTDVKMNPRTGQSSLTSSRYKKN